jgi:murein DD-endopeptidase MepM/ murein hydrolase activator NlpD
MMRYSFLIILSAIFLSCKSGKSLFTNNSNLHDQYAGRLNNAGLDKSAMGRMWINAGQSALSSPLTIQLPYKERGYFSADLPRALGFKFHTKRGQQIRFYLDKKPKKNFILFADLWTVEQRPSLIYSFDTSRVYFNYDIEQDGMLLLRIQPELLQSGEYELSISTGPSLKFPVSGRTSHIGSFWGDARDAGARNHEGLDIFAPKGTQVVAAANGKVMSVTENKLGGKVVFLRPSGKDFTLYYAHLDAQLVSPGQSVKEGEPVGLVGNTGNAVNTPSHLHFGIYTDHGAIDPLPFVNPEIKTAEDVTYTVKELQQVMRLSNPAEIIFDGYKKEVFPGLTILFPRSASAQMLNGELPDGRLITVPLKSITLVKSIKQQTITSEQELFDSPDTLAPRKKILAMGNSVLLLGYFGRFAYVKTDENTTGWIFLKPHN